VFLGLGLVLATGALARSNDQASIDPELHDPAPRQWVEDLRDRTCGGDHCGRILGLDGNVQPNTGSLAGLRDLRGYDLPVSTETRGFMAALNPTPESPWFPVYETPARGLLLFSGVRFLVRNGEDGEREIVEIDARAPRAWLASGAVAVNDSRQALEMISRQEDVRGRPPVEGLEKSIEGSGSRPLAITEIGSGRIEMTVEGGASGLLVLADAWAPGWRVEIDGEERRLLRVGGYFRGVEIEPGDGDRTVAFVYRPDGWRWGLWTAGASLAGLLVLVLFGRRKG
jgi:hypothetical protein